MILQRRLSDVNFSNECKTEKKQDFSVLIDSKDAMRSYDSQLKLIKERIKKECMLNCLCYELVDRGVVSYKDAYLVVMSGTNDISIVEDFLLQHGVVLSSYNPDEYFKKPEAEKKKRVKKDKFSLDYMTEL